MRLQTRDGEEIKASFDVAATDLHGQFEVTLASAGGSGVGATRNPDYPRLLEELLRRFAALGVVVEDAVVSSAKVNHLARDERRIHVKGRPYPVTPSPREDLEDLRKGFTRPQANIGSSRQGGGGNQRKKITITIRLDEPVSLKDLVRLLGASESPSRERRAGIASGLTRHHVEVAIDRWEEVGRDEFLSEFDAPEAHRYVVADGDRQMDAMALLLGARALAGLAVEGPWRGDRVNVAEPLRNMGFGVEDLQRPDEAPLGEDPGRYVDLAARLGGTDVAVKRMGRREQGYLRGSLGIGSGDPKATATCGMCGRVLPQSLLVAAHIKPRNLCTDAERLDMPDVGWPLCLLGCDALFEKGYVSVNDAGRVEALPDMADAPLALREAIASVHGRTVAVDWTMHRRGYFEAHRASHHG